jgi:hypothetical protein
MADITFLDMVNGVLQKLREQEIASFTNGNLEEVVKGLLNESMHEILEDYSWSFLIREDAQAFFPARYIGTTLDVTNGISSGAFNDATTTSADWRERRRSKLIVTEDTTFPNHSYVISAISADVTQPVTLESIYRGDTIVGADFTLYSHEMALPETVRQVLSVRNENEPMRLVFVEKQISFDTLVPRVTDQFRDRPDVVYVGGIMQSTVQGTDAANFGTGLMVWPPPSSDIVLKYSYVYRYEDMATETDVLLGVPKSVVRMIEWTAFQKSLMGNVEDDAARGRALRIENDLRISRLRAQDRPQTHHRLIPRAYGDRVHGPVNPRWETQEVPTPYPSGWFP